MGCTGGLWCPSPPSAPTRSREWSKARLTGFHQLQNVLEPILKLIILRENQKIKLISWIFGHYPHLSNDCRPIHSAVQNKRRETGIDLFRTQSQLKGYTLAETYFLFVTGRSLAGKMMTVEEYMERGAAISAIKSAWIEMPNVSFNFIVNFLKISVSNLHFSSFVSIVDFPNISVSKFHF